MNKHGRFFFFNDTPTTETYTLSLHDALPISLCRIKRVPEARLCTRSCSWDSSLTTPGGSPVRELRPPGSVRGASSNGCPYRDRPEITRGMGVISGSAALTLDRTSV